MMIENVRGFLADAGVPDQQVKYELFTAPSARTLTGRAVTEDKPHNPAEESMATVILDGDAFDFPLPYDGNTILEAAIEHGADAPFACKGGVCCTCKAKLVEGEVKMDVVYGLEPDEIANGYILTCQAHPRSKKIIVDFDS
jgi:ring-1,2-phenylacetyl-CoA epoxidase subunit PaaE